MIEEVIIAFFNAVAFSTLAFFPVFMSGSYSTFFMANFITTCIGIVLGYLVAAVSPTMEIANSVNSKILILSEVLTMNLAETVASTVLTAVTLLA